MRLEPIPTLDAARPAWEALEQPAGHLFATWAWADAWWRVYGRGRRLELHAVHDGDRLAAILPLYRADRGPLPVLRLIGHGAGDELGPVCAPADAALAAAALRTVARERLPRHGLLLLDRLRGDGPLLPAVGGPVVRTESSPVLVPEGRTSEEWMATRSSSFRREHRRRANRLERLGVRYRLVDDPGELDAAIDALLRLHRARWGDEASTAFSPPRVELHRAFAHRALERGWLRLAMAEVDGRAVASCYGVRFGEHAWFYQTGRDPAWDHEGVGSGLFHHGVCAAIDRGARVLRFGVGDEPYKARYATADPGVRSVVVARPASRRAAVAAARGMRRLPPAVRRPVARHVH